MTEVEQAGVILENLLVILMWQLGDGARDAAAGAVSPRLEDALDGALHGTEQGLLRMVRRALATDDPKDPFIVQWPKIRGDVRVSYERLSIALITSCSRWLSRRRDELEQQQQAKGDTIVEREVGYGGR
jgi:hypothetical protein